MYSAGNVVQIRLNTEDVMGCIDILKHANVDTTGMSLAMVTRLVLSAYLEGSRLDGTIPRRDGFEYSQMIAPFVHTSKAKKIQTTNAVLNTEIALIKVDKPASQFALHVQPSKDAPRAGHDIPMQLSPELEQKERRIMVKRGELMMKQDADPDNFSQQEERLLDALGEALELLRHGQDVDISKLL